MRFSLLAIRFLRQTPALCFDLCPVPGLLRGFLKPTAYPVTSYGNFSARPVDPLVFPLHIGCL